MYIKDIDKRALPKREKPEFVAKFTYQEARTFEQIVLIKWVYDTFLNTQFEEGDVRVNMKRMAEDILTQHESKV